MVKQHLIVLLMFLLACPAGAQEQSSIDSLKAVIITGEHDTIVCKAYLSWGQQLYRKKPDTAAILFQNAYDLAQRMLASRSNEDLNERYLFFLAEATNSLGIIFNYQGDISKALEYYEKALIIREEIGDQFGIAYSLFNIGFIYKNQGDISKALEYQGKGLKIQEVIGNKPGIAHSLNIIGLLYEKQDDIQKALEYYKRSLKISEGIEDNHGIASSLNGIGIIYKRQNELNTALEYFERGLKIRKEMNDKIGMAQALNNIGIIYRDLGDPIGAFNFFTESVKAYEEIGNKQGMAGSLRNIGDLHVMQGNLTEAQKYADQSMTLAQDLGNPDLISNSANLLSSVHRKMGNHKEALGMYELHIQMRDSIKNEETQKAAIRQQTKYEFEKALLVKEQEEKEKARLEAEVLDRRDNLQYSVILIALLVLFGGVLALGFINVSERTAEGIIFFSFLIFFEFLLVLADPYIEGWSGGAPGIKLLFNAGIAALIFPAHAFFETRLKGRLVKNRA